MEPQKQLVSRRGAVLDIAERLQQLQTRLEYEISAEPTGHPRNQLTEANIHLMAAIMSLTKVV